MSDNKITIGVTSAIASALIGFGAGTISAPEKTPIPIIIEDKADVEVELTREVYEKIRDNIFDKVLNDEPLSINLELPLFIEFMNKEHSDVGLDFKLSEKELIQQAKTYRDEKGNLISQ